MNLTLLEIEAFAMLYHRQDSTVMNCASNTGYGEARDRLIDLGLVTNAGHATRRGQEFARRLRQVAVPEARKKVKAS